MDQNRFDKAIALRDSGYMLDAIQEFLAMAEEAEDVNEKLALLLGEVRCYADLGRLADAERILTQIWELKHDNVAACFDVGFMAATIDAQAGRHEKAVDAFHELLQDYADLLQTPEYCDFYEDIQQRRAASY